MDQLSHALEIICHGNKLSRQIAQLDNNGLSTTALAILHNLRNGKPMPGRELQAVVGVTQGTLSIALQKLRDRGWVDASRDIEDKRNLMFVLTPAGRKECDKILDHIEANIVVESPLHSHSHPLRSRYAKPPKKTSKTPPPVEPPAPISGKAIRMKKKIQLSNPSQPDLFFS